MNTTRIAVVGLFGALVGFALQGCFTPQPLPECDVKTPFYAKLTRTNATGTCPDLDHMTVTAERYHAPGSKEYRLVVKSSRIVNWAYGEVDGQERVDPTDPKLARLANLADVTQYPTNGVCTLSNWDGGFQNFEPVLDADGGIVAPAIAVGLEWSDFKLYATSYMPGTAFTAKLTYTEGACKANYDVKAFWPPVSCEPDLLPDGGEGDDAWKQSTANAYCNPFPDQDAGQVVGSGMHPEFKPVCNVGLGICEPTIDFDELAKKG